MDATEKVRRLNNTEKWHPTPRPVVNAMLDVIAAAEVARFGLPPTDPHRRDLEDAFVRFREAAE